LKGILIKNRLGFLSDITNQHRQTWEHIYEVTTKNPSVKIIIFSSVDMRTGCTRENGTDRVRIVMQWTTKNGVVYKRIARHNRLATLFENVKSTLLNVKVFDLNYKEFNNKLPF
jgi:hypothetical protein